MCLAAIAWKLHPRYAAVVIANRDEYHARPTRPIEVWEDAPAILAGRDLQAGGTWLGVTSRARFGLVTNFRELSSQTRAALPSRGRLIPEFLTGEQTASSYLGALAHSADDYAGFNMLLCDGAQLWYASNRAKEFAQQLGPGHYGLCNHLLDTPWPKLAKLRRVLGDWASSGTTDLEPLWSALGDRRRAAEHTLPATGVSTEWESILSSAFVQHPDYGTRCTTILLLDHDGHWSIEERSFDATGEPCAALAWRANNGSWPPDRLAL